MGQAFAQLRPTSYPEVVVPAVAASHQLQNKPYRSKSFPLPPCLVGGCGWFGPGSSSCDDFGDTTRIGLNGA
eukprot:5369278-Amphidinium_carterae.1